MCREIGRRKVRDMDLSANSIHPRRWKGLWASSLGEGGAPALLPMHALLSSRVIEPQHHCHWSPVSRHHRHASSYLLPSLFSCLCRSEFSYVVLQGLGLQRFCLPATSCDVHVAGVTTWSICNHQPSGHHGAIVSPRQCGSSRGLYEGGQVANRAA